GRSARFRYPTGITLDGEGNLYVADQSNHTIRKVTSLGEVSTIAGKPLAKGTNDGFGADARFNSPRAITYNRDGNLYVADAGNSTIRRVTPAGQVTTLAGAPGQWSYAFIDGKGDAARFCWITGI